MEQSIEIKAPPGNVWELLAWDRVREWEKGWQDNLKRIEYTYEDLTSLTIAVPSQGMECT
jgi:hypothetical protein